MTLDILRRTGGWCVELAVPLRHGPGREIEQIEIRTATADQIIRWTQGQIPSLMSLLSELCGVSEMMLRQLSSGDFERVTMAMLSVIPSIIKESWERGERPLATPVEELPQELSAPPPDQIDPRFPAADGPVRRLQKREPPRAPAPELPPEPPPEGGELNMGMPDMIRPAQAHA